MTETTQTASERPQAARRPRVLVIGATGGVGRQVARTLAARGHEVVALHRDPERAARGWPGPEAVRWVRGDAMNERDVVEAAAGAGLLFHGANPPGYRNWRELAIPMLRNAVAAARANGARLIFPGNVYNFGPDAGPVVTERSPQNPRTRKGAVRVEMERMLAEAAPRGARSLVVRAGDFLGATPGSWFQAVMVRPGKPVRSVTYPGRREVGHAWAHLPDLAETIARLAEIERDLADFEVFHFGGHWIEPGVEIAHAVRRVLGRPDLPIRSFPWPVVRLASPFVPFLRELLEMRYLWEVPLRLDDAKLVGVLGQVPHTPLDEAVRRTLTDMGVLPAGGEPAR